MLHFLPGDGIGAMFLQPRNNVRKVKYGAIGGADRVFERLKTERAVVEGKPFEGSSTGPLLGAGRGREY